LTCADHPGPEDEIHEVYIPAGEQLDHIPDQGRGEFYHEQVLPAAAE
jgi:hypothetical protein